MGNFKPKCWNMKVQVYQKVLNQSTCHNVRNIKYSSRVQYDDATTIPICRTDALLKIGFGYRPISAPYCQITWALGVKKQNHMLTRFAWRAVRSVTLNLPNKFSQYTFTYFSGLVILRQAWWRRSYDDIPHRSHRTDRETAAEKLNGTTPTLKLICSLPMMLYATNSESTATSNPSRTTDAVFTKLPPPLAKDRKNTLANSRPI